MISAWVVLGTRLGTPGTNWQKAWGDAGEDWYGFYDRLRRCTRLPALLYLGSGIRDFLHVASMIPIHPAAGIARVFLRNHRVMTACQDAMTVQNNSMPSC
jgi:hypothetical protein